MVRFGPSGNSPAFYEAGFEKSIDAPKWLHDIGLDLYEYSFTRGVALNDDTARKIGENAKKYDITVTAHAPYYINLANPDDEMAEKSFGYILDSLKKLKLMGGQKCVVHTASQGKVEREVAMELVRARLRKLDQLLTDHDLRDMYVCLETMGKYSQIGSYIEIIDLCTLSDRFMPTFDFGHINCVTQGSLKAPENYRPIIDYCLEKLGEERTKNMHVHFSKIEYNEKGEIKHLTMEDQKYGPEFEPFAHIILEYGLEPTIVSESRDKQSDDAKYMKDIFVSLKNS